jgi:dynein assembly factor with WDR repeat domains 1
MDAHRNTLVGLQSKITQKKSYHLRQKIRAHSMPLTNCVFDKSGGRFSFYYKPILIYLLDFSLAVMIEQLKYGNVIAGKSSCHFWAIAILSTPSHLILHLVTRLQQELWDSEDGRNISTFNGHQREVVCTTFDPQSCTLATGSLDQTAKLWDIRNGQEIKTIRGHSGELVSASYSSDGNYLLTGSFDATVNIWDCREQKILHRLIGHRGEISNALFNYTGTKIISGSVDGTVRIWDAVSGSCLKVAL